MENDIQFMRLALELAKRGEGLVEPNPMVGCVLVKNGNVIGKGFHTQFGKPHAEIEALHDAQKCCGEESVAGSTCYVTLEPCSHYGKTPPCTAALQSSGIRRIVVAMRDPNPLVNGQGLKILRDAGFEITEHVLENEAHSLNAPYLTLLQKHRPWIIAKWAMTLDGRLASRTGSSRWISSEASRKIVHRLRSRMDAIMIGSQTALRDNPDLTARLDEVVPRTPIRIVLDSNAALTSEYRLVQTARQIPVLLVVNHNAPKKRIKTLQDAGCEILPLLSENTESENTESENIESKNTNPENTAHDYRNRTEILMKLLAQRKITNLLVEGGKQVFGTLFDMKLIDEAHVFIAPKLIGGESAYPVVGGIGLAEMERAWKLELPEIQITGQDVYIHGRILYKEDDSYILKR
ncbi:MAG: bifunctional diaminohydroxyphosphoribosylaminopyrimidine deaminase/5-amino-6-(5-phosphoribosylamino)uracil reductase RibD [Planctomycetaceae bacterium]|jgi:diaminohydroxyphosphoribosylaminopyrimidine deaminase/5-amino-6-(5-phosphoribosylamino)uracil reductase|nr:bifunctional diaminohydroxyphosphoribosylaminopyrimidine deaminase/5-amino-6-(5-phosphoribosylamino)uracil reductase RibD [Planctomycetaceae bacterium]